MARAVARHGHGVEIYATDWGLQDEVDASGSPIRQDGVAIRYFPAQFPMAWKTSWPLARALRREIRDFDVVHLHSLYVFHDFVTGRICHQAGVPYLVRPHGTLDPFIYRRSRIRKRVMEVSFQNRVLRRAAAIHYTTEEEMRLAEPSAQGAPGVVVALGLDTESYDKLPAPERVRARHPEIADRRIVLFLGRLHEKKGLDILAEAFGRDVAGRDDLHLVIAGPDDGVGSRLEEWLRGAGIRDRTTLTGMIEGEEKLAAYAASEVFVLPSYSENFGLAVLEAMAAGVPVLVSDKVNLWREVVSSGAGLAATCSAEAFDACLVQMLDKPDATRRMGERGYCIARERFSWERIAVELERLYASVATSRRSTE